MAALIQEEQLDEHGQPTKQRCQVKWKIKNTKTMACYTDEIDDSDDDDDENFSGLDSDQKSNGSSQSDIEIIPNDEVRKPHLAFSCIVVTPNIACWPPTLENCSQDKTHKTDNARKEEIMPGDGWRSQRWR